MLNEPTAYICLSFSNVSFHFVPFAAQAVWPSPTVGFTVIKFSLIFGDKYEIVKWTADTTFVLNIFLSISRTSSRSYCWHSDGSCSYSAVTCNLYIFQMLPKDEGGGIVALYSI